MPIWIRYYTSDEEVTISELDLQIKDLSHYSILYNKKAITNDKQEDRWEKNKKITKYRYSRH